MELAIRLQMEELPEGVFPAASDELSGLIVQGRTVAEPLEIALMLQEIQLRRGANVARFRICRPPPIVVAGPMKDLELSKLSI
jgi:hypothetical protein